MDIGKSKNIYILLTTKGSQEEDKMSKISSLQTMPNCNLLQFGIFHELLSVDESVMPYLGRHSAKIFIRGNPIRFGYKFGVCVEVIIIRITCRYIRESSQTQLTSL